MITYTVMLMLLQSRSTISIKLPSCLPLEALSIHPTPNPIPIRVLFIDLPWTNQAQFRETPKFYLQLRHMHNETTPSHHMYFFSPLITYLYLINSSFNSTIVSSAGFPDICIPANWQVTKYFRKK